MGADNTFGEEHFNPDMMNSTDALREFAEKYKSKVNYIDRGLDEKLSVENYWNTQQLLFDLTALISEKQAEYFEFVKWIGFYSTTLYYRDIDEKWLRTRFDIDGMPTEQYDEYTTEELFEYWKTNEQ